MKKIGNFEIKVEPVNPLEDLLSKEKFEQFKDKLGCIYRSCGKKPKESYFCTTKHAILDYLDAYGYSKLMEIVTEWVTMVE